MEGKNGAYDNLCMSCMADRGENTVCPVCGFSETESQPGRALPYRTVTAKPYLVGQVKRNGEGFRYIGYDTMLLPVKIRELFPKNLCREPRIPGKFKWELGREDLREVFPFFFGIFQNHRWSQRSSCHGKDLRYF